MNLVILGGVCLFILKLIKDDKKALDKITKEENKRKGIPINWPDGLNQEVFEEICRKAAKPIKRLKIKSFDGLYISCEVRTSSGLSTWDFFADFYDYGELSGRYFTNYIENKEQLDEFIKILKQDKYFKKATHNSFAYRIKQENGSLLEGKNDD